MVNFDSWTYCNICQNISGTTKNLRIHFGSRTCLPARLRAVYAGRALVLRNPLLFLLTMEVEVVPHLPSISAFQRIEPGSSDAIGLSRAQVLAHNDNVDDQQRCSGRQLPVQLKRSGAPPRMSTEVRKASVPGSCASSPYPRKKIVLYSDS